MTETAVLIGTRASALALAQAGLIADRFAAKFAVDVELVPITSEGDRNNASLAMFGGTGVFHPAVRVGNGCAEKVIDGIAPACGRVVQRCQRSSP